MEIIIHHESIQEGYVLLFDEKAKPFYHALKSFLESLKVLNSFNCNVYLDLNDLITCMKEYLGKNKASNKRIAIGYDLQILNILSKLKGGNLKKFEVPIHNSSIEYKKKVFLSNELQNENNSFMRKVVEKTYSSENETLLFYFPDSAQETDFGYIPFIRKETNYLPILNFHSASYLIPSDLIKVLTSDNIEVVLKYLITDAIYNHVTESKYRKIINSEPYKTWLTYDSSKWNPSADSLPHKNLSDFLCAKSNWSAMRTSLKSTPSRSQIAKSKELFHLIALINNYHYNQKLSALNSSKTKNRLIYSSTNLAPKETIHLSLDMEKFGVYEKCNHNGEHLGEFNFGDSQTKKADIKKHSIRVE